MAVRIRLARGGRKKKPFYRVVATNSTSPRDGRFLEIIGTYDPLKDPGEFKINREKLQKWINRGAEPSNTVKNLLLKAAQ